MISSGLSAIGSIDPICPYCLKHLVKKPSRKAKCPFCKQFIFVRTRPLDRERVLVTKDQATEIENQWASFQRSYIYDDVDPKEIEEVKANYYSRHGATLSDYDAKWSILNSQLLMHSKNSDWGLYRNTRLSMASVMEHEGKVLDSIHTYLEVCYIDINGPRNCGGIKDTELLEEYPAFSSEEAFLAPAVLTKVKELAAMLQINEGELRHVFLESTTRIFLNLKLPISPDKAWHQFQEGIKSA